MKFDLTKPCGRCPFRNDITPYLRKDRAVEISKAITEQQGTFQCHKTLDKPKDQHQHCAGAAIVLEKMEMPNQWMRIAERFGGYDHTKLDMKAPVFENVYEFIKAQRSK